MLKNNSYHSEEIFSSLKQGTGENDDKIGAVTNFLLLHLRGQHQQLGSGMLNLELLDDGSSVVGYEQFLQVIDHHFIHAIRSVGTPQGVRQLLARTDVPVDGFLQATV